MKAHNHYYEVLLFSDTQFASREFCFKKDKQDNRKLSQKDELEKACWAGILCDVLPEIVGNGMTRNENYIWNIVSGYHYLHINLGPVPFSPENEFSIDPYFFLSVMNNC